MKVLFFGAGSYAGHLWEEIKTEPKLYLDEYLAFTDNDERLWGKFLCGVKIIAPTEICSYDSDLIVISSTIYERAIHRQLIEELGIQKEKVYTWQEYTRFCSARRIHREKYGIDISKNGDSLIHSGRAVVYTAITGNYDSLKDPLFTDDNLSYVCITNNVNIKSGIWDVKYIEDNHMDNIHLARHIKMNPHVYFPDYEISIWVDGKFRILDDLRVYAARYRRQSNILCFPHPERSCICDELAACILWTNGINKSMIMQVADYLKEGFPTHYGLYDTGCIVRFHNDASVKRVMKQWEDEVTKYSFRDQLSFPYVCWKNGYTPDICDLDIGRNHWLSYKGHL